MLRDYRFWVSIWAICKISEDHNIFAMTIAASVFLDIIRRIINKREMKLKLYQITLDALSASDLLLCEREQPEKEQQEKSGLNRIKK